MSAQKKATATPADTKKKHIIIGIIAVILLLNITWTIMQNKFTPKLDGIKADVAGIAQRLTNIEDGDLPQVANLKQEYESLKAISDKFSERAKQLLKAEEEQLAYLEAQVAAQKARVEELRKLAAE